MKVEFTPAAAKNLAKVPHFIFVKMREWSEAVERFGIREVRKAKGYHDEPLQGQRRGQRSMRLSRSYRAIYVESVRVGVEIITVIEVNKHEY